MTVIKKMENWQGIMAHTFNSNILQAEEDRSLSLRAAWPTLWVPEDLEEILSQNKQITKYKN